MIPETRRQMIMDILSKSTDGLVTITGLSQQIGVSEMTIRRDLDTLEKNELVKRIHGGAIALKGAIIERPYVERAQEANTQKMAIGRLAASLVGDHESIILDSGTTTLRVAHNLTSRNNLVVVTNNIAITQKLGPYSQIKLYQLGGQVKPREMCTVGLTASQELSQFSVDKTFLATAGFSIENGITDIDLLEVELKQGMIRVARQVILVSDSTKFNTTALLKVAPLNVIAKLVTDDDLPEAAVRAVEAEGIEVITPSRHTSFLEQPASSPAH